MFFNLLRLNLQYFSIDDPAGGGDPGNPPTDPEPKDPPKDLEDPKPKDPPEKTFTQEDVDKMVKDRLARAEKDKEKAIKEAEKLAKMTADQKREYEFEKLQRENEKLKAAQNKYELGKEATKILSESGITATDEILEFVVREDAEKTSEAVKAFSELVDRISEERMKEKLKGKPPKKQAGSPGAMTKESIMAIKDSAKRIQAIQDHPHLFKTN